MGRQSPLLLLLSGSITLGPVVIVLLYLFQQGDVQGMQPRRWKLLVLVMGTGVMLSGITTRFLSLHDTGG